MVTREAIRLIKLATKVTRWQGSIDIIQSISWLLMTCRRIEGINNHSVHLHVVHLVYSGPITKMVSAKPHLRLSSDDECNFCSIWASRKRRNRSGWERTFFKLRNGDRRGQAYWRTDIMSWPRELVKSNESCLYSRGLLWCGTVGRRLSFAAIAWWYHSCYITFSSWSF